MRGMTPIISLPRSTSLCGKLDYGTRGCASPITSLMSWITKTGHAGTLFSGLSVSLCSTSTHIYPAISASHISHYIKHDTQDPGMRGRDACRVATTMRQPSKRAGGWWYRNARMYMKTHKKSAASSHTPPRHEAGMKLSAMKLGMTKYDLATQAHSAEGYTASGKDVLSTFGSFAMCVVVGCVSGRTSFTLSHVLGNPKF